MNFKELRQKAELLNLLNMQKRTTLQDQKDIILLNLELSKFAKFFEVSTSTFQKYIEEHFKSMGKSVNFLVETTPANGYKKSDKYVTKNYIISVYNKNFSERNVKPDKRYTWQSKTFSENKPMISTKFNLMNDLFESPIKTTFFNEVSGIKEVYWKMVEENFRIEFNYKSKRILNPKTGKYQTEKFNKNTTDINNLKEIKNTTNELITI